jgi:hypothetical protein
MTHDTSPRSGLATDFTTFGMVHDPQQPTAERQQSDSVTTLLDAASISYAHARNSQMTPDGESVKIIHWIVTYHTRTVKP